MDDLNLKGFRVLVTGSSGGIGKVLVKDLLGRGAFVGAHYFKNKPDINELTSGLPSKLKKNVHILKADLRAKKETEGLFNEFISWKGGIDGLVNNAGDVCVRKSFLDVNEDEIDHELSLNLKAPFWLSRLTIKNMEKNKTKGAIVNISSIAAKYGGSLYTVFYGLAKSSLELMTSSLSRYCAPLGIRINTLRLSVFDTPFHDRHPKDLKKRIEMIPAKRMGSPEEASWWIMCLLSKKSDFINGQTVSLTGGE